MTARSGAESSRTTGARRTKDYLVAGRIVRPHGLRGEVVVEPEFDWIGRLRAGRPMFLGEDKRRARVSALRAQGARYLVGIEGCTTRSQAEKLRGQIVHLRPADLTPLPDGVYYRWQLVGLAVETDDGQPLGELVEIFATGANDVYEVRLEDGRRVLLPAIEPVVRGIDLEHGVVRIRLMPGLIDP